MRQQLPEGEVSRDEVWLFSFFALVGVGIALFGGLRLPSSLGNGLLWLSIGLGVATLSAYIVYDRIKRFAEARETAFWLAVWMILFP
jgi:hypothetical protein